MGLHSSGERPVRDVQDQQGLEDLWAALDRADWVGFDTEFIGEKRDVPLLCLLQVITEEAIWLVDTIKLEQWEAFGDYVANPALLKITHAGENDYRLLYQLLGVLPRNVFDLQVAAGFIGQRYPASLGTILQEVLQVSAAKAFTVADWSVRPLPEKMKAYAVEDVRYLPELFERMGYRLRELGRFDWVAHEMRAWEDPAMYTPDPLKKLLQQKTIAPFSEKEKLFMMRLARWREEESVTTGQKSEEILSNKQLMEMAKLISSGSEALFRSRILPKAFIRNHKDRLIQWYQQPAGTDELALLYQYAPREAVDPAVEGRTQLVLLLLQAYCLEQHLSLDLLLPASENKKYRIIPGYRFEDLYRGWRANFLPRVWQELLENREHLRFQMREDGILLTHS
jgi:ribonuclease D